MSKQIARRRGRPRQFDTEHAVETAQKLFHAHGYDSVGVTLLARKMGIEQPSLYAAFGNKLGLFAAAVDRYASSDGAFINEAFSDAETVKEGLRNMLKTAAINYSRKRSSAGCLIMEGAQGTHDEGARSLCADKRAATEAFIADYVERDHPGHGNTVSAMSMIALAGLSASARAGMTRKQLLEFARFATNGLCELLANNAAALSTSED